MRLTAGGRCRGGGGAGLASRRGSSCTVTDLYYPGLQDGPLGRDKPNDGRGQ